MRSDIEAAILGMYDSIERAREAQAAAGHSDQGARQGITSGKHLDPIAAIIRDDLINAGFHPDEVYDQGRMCTLPGWFRPTKNWDLLALDAGELVSAIELKSINSSFGNNANNRAEESIGSAFDAHTAFDENLRFQQYSTGHGLCDDSSRLSGQSDCRTWGAVSAFSD